MSSSSSSSGSLARSYRIQEPSDPTELRHATPILAATFADGAAFLHAFDGSARAGELAVVTRATPCASSWVVLEIDWPGLPNPVYVRAQVQRRRFGLMARLHPDEISAARFLLQIARCQPVRYFRRVHHRYCVRFPVWWRRFGASERNPGVAEDLSAGGVLVATVAPPPPVGERVGLRLIVPSAQQDLVVTGEVTHARERSRDAAFGVEFALRGSGEQRTLRRLLRTFAGRGVVTLE
jgi:hypothetical protein